MDKVDAKTLLRRVLNGGDVLRFHTAGKGIYQQNVAEHTWRMLTILLAIWPDASRELLETALYHDVPEWVTGDPPAHFKWQYPEVAKVLSEVDNDIFDAWGLPSPARLPEEDYIRYKIADLFELYITTRQQNHNSRAREITARVDPALAAFVDKLPTVEERDRVLGFLFAFDKG